MMVPWKGGLVSSEDTLGEVFPCSVSQQDGFVCSDDIIDRGIFSGGKYFSDDDDVKEAFGARDDVIRVRLVSAVTS